MTTGFIVFYLFRLAESSGNVKLVFNKGIDLVLKKFRGEILKSRTILRTSTNISIFSLDNKENQANI